MRISQETQQVIKNTVKEIFGDNVVVSLFGSRIDDALKGGDIDLLVQSNALINDRQQKKLQMVARLQIRLGDQPIDVVVVDPGVDLQVIHKEAIRTGVLL